MNLDFSDFIRFFPIFRLFPTFRLSNSTALVATLYYISPSKQQRNIVHLCTNPSLNIMETQSCSQHLHLSCKKLNAAQVVTF